MGLCGYELRVLRHVRSYGDIPFGAAPSQAAEVLESHGLIEEIDIGGFKVTPAGVRALKPRRLEDLWQ